jgi:DNA polymerase-3 subunit chi
VVEVDFYTGVSDKFAAACRLAAKACANRFRVLISLASREQAESLDRLMWTSPVLSFLPHCLSDHSLASETPVVLRYGGTQDAADVLINLTQDAPGDMDRFPRVIELVGWDEDDREAARARWRSYRARGFALRSYALDPEE